MSGRTSRKKSTRSHSTKSQRRAQRREADKEAEREESRTRDRTDTDTVRLSTASRTTGPSVQSRTRTNHAPSINDDHDARCNTEQLFHFLSESDGTPAPGRRRSLTGLTTSNEPIDPDEAQRTARWWVWAMIILFAILIRYTVSGGSYSGKGTPPMFGDYEAQRHWMEVTVNLPITEWYHNTTRNDLQYWGLDYPPLTAYVSYAFGKLAEAVGEQDLVALGTSRGYESVSSKYFMRMSVLLCDVVLFLPAVVFALRAIYPNMSRSRLMLVVHLVWLSPVFILIDHGHFQYNCFSLGLVAWAIWACWRGNDLLAAVCFVLSLTFKQMSLYYAPAFFAYMLARTRMGKGGGAASIEKTLTRLLVLGSVVILTFVLVFLPFLSSFSSIGQVVHRMFPFARGLYEDKVSNFWCATSIAIKWHLWFPREWMVKAALGSTVLAFLPSCIHVYLHTSRKSFLYTLTLSAVAFYLFSFQVHEKSILLPALPFMLLIGTHPLLATWMSGVATFSMYPMLQRDGHIASYVALQIVFLYQSMSHARVVMNQGSTDRDVPDTSGSISSIARGIIARVNHLISPKLQFFLVCLSFAGMVVLHLFARSTPAPARLPDLHNMLCVIYSALHFMLFYVILLTHQWAIPNEASEDYELQSIKRQKRT